MTRRSLSEPRIRRDDAVRLYSLSSVRSSRVNRLRDAMNSSMRTARIRNERRMVVAIQSWRESLLLVSLMASPLPLLGLEDDRVQVEEERREPDVVEDVARVD